MTILTAGQLESLHVQIRHVPASAPLKWVDQAWDDLRHIGAPGLAHGALIAILGAVLLMLGSSHMYFIAAAVSGYLLVGPVMTTGLCELARRRATREPLRFDDSLQGMTRNLDGLLHFGGLLALVAMVWFALAALLLQTTLRAAPPSLAVALWGGSTSLTAAQWVGFIVCGAVLAAAVFTVSVVAVPLIIDRHARATEAVRISMQATLANLPAMLVWAALIVAITALGFVTLLVGMVIVAPLLGYATWHAYRDLIG